MTRCDDQIIISFAEKQISDAIREENTKTYWVGWCSVDMQNGQFTLNWNILHLTMFFSSWRHESTKSSIANVLNETQNKMYMQNPFLSATLLSLFSKQCSFRVPYRKYLSVCVHIWQVAQNLSSGNTKQNDGSENSALVSSGVPCSCVCGVRVRVEAYITNAHTHSSAQRSDVCVDRTVNF